MILYLMVLNIMAAIISSYNGYETEAATFYTAATVIMAIHFKKP